VAEPHESAPVPRNSIRLEFRNFGTGDVIVFGSATLPLGRIPVAEPRPIQPIERIEKFELEKN